MEGSEIERIWKIVQDIELLPLNLTFKNKRSKSYPGHPKWGGVCWVSLIPDKLDLLTEMHLEIAKVIKIPLNAAFNEYDPHLTLLNSCSANKCDMLNNSPALHSPLKEEFIIALGLIDDVGQLTEILYCNN